MFQEHLLDLQELQQFLCMEAQPPGPTAGGAGTLIEAGLAACLWQPDAAGRALCACVLRPLGPTS